MLLLLLLLMMFLLLMMLLLLLLLLLLALHGRLLHSLHVHACRFLKSPTVITVPSSVSPLTSIMTDGTVAGFSLHSRSLRSFPPPDTNSYLNSPGGLCSQFPPQGKPASQPAAIRPFLFALSFSLPPSPSLARA